MCGFVGVLGDRHVEIAKAQVEAISHRGPDSRGQVVSSNFELWFARLSINGLSNGEQPIWSPNRKFVGVVNGEIYNHAEIRSELVKLGVLVSSDSDVAVVLAGWETWGTGVIERLEGMFAFAIIDVERSELILARDRMGKKPLYWRRDGAAVYFASEIPAIWKKGTLPTGTEASEFFLRDSISWNFGIPSLPRAVPSGHYLVVRKSDHETHAFWDLEKEVARERNLFKDNKDWHSILQERLIESVRARLMAEVPIGTFLSSGLDSKIVTAIAAQFTKIETAFTLRFTNDSFDESHDARAFASSLGIETELVDAGLDSLEAAWHVLRNSIDEPVADPAILGQILLSRSAGKSLKVVLTGDGADELFFGYQHILAHVAAEAGLLRLATPLLRLLFRLGNPHNDRYFSLVFVIERLLRGMDADDFIERDFLWRVSSTPDSLLGLVETLDQEDIQRFLHDVRVRIQDSANSNYWPDTWTRLYLREYLEEIILKKVDRATMLFGVEARSPLLDRRFVETSLALPRSQRNPWVSRKRALRFVAKNFIHARYLPKKKHGMGIPLQSLLNGPLQQDLFKFSAPDFIRQQEIFTPSGVANLIKRFQVSPANHSREIWAFMVFQAWYARIETSGVE